MAVIYAPQSEVSEPGLTRRVMPIVRTRLGTPPQMRAVCVTPPKLDLAEEGSFCFPLASLPAAAPTEQRMNSKETRR